MPLPTDVNSSPNYTAVEHAAHHNEIHTAVNGLPAAWSSWTPTLTNLTQGNGTITAKYIQTGKTVHYRFKFVLGSTSAVGSGPTFTLPVAAHADYVAIQDVYGSANMVDAGTAAYVGRLRATSTTVGLLLAENAGGALTVDNSVSSTVPFTWATGDSISVYGTYEAA